LKQPKYLPKISDVSARTVARLWQVWHFHGHEAL